MARSDDPILRDARRAQRCAPLANGAQTTEEAERQRARREGEARRRRARYELERMRREMIRRRRWSKR